ncbi:MAG TPA: SatD family protein [Candidatus Methylomirabilis sp.]
MTYTALIGDLVGSRGIGGKRRGAIQRDLTEYFGGLLPEESPGLRSQPALTLGDEFQALFSAHERPSAILEFLIDVQDLCRPEGVRFGIGVGGLTTDLRPTAIGMDGPCFHRARGAIGDSRSRDLACGVQGEDDLVAEMLSYLISHTLEVRKRWTAEQREAIHSYLSLDDDQRSWTRVAEQLGRSPSAITQRQQGAQWKRIQAMAGVIERGLARLEGSP